MSSAPYAINDPIHGIMQFSKHEAELIKNVIDSPYFQRLRYIKQLSFAHLIYPGATHTRFIHCLGACYLAKTIFENIENFLNIDKETAKEQKKIAMLAGLLHDIGHGPYSHSFEKIRYTEDKNFNIKHEEFNKPLINLLMDSNKFLEKDQDIFQKTITVLGKKCDEIPELRMVSELISSQLDADRMDYLLRDSHFCGVEYGKYSPEWLCRCLTYSERINSIVFFRKGIGTIEHFLFARRLMHKYVYLHPKKVICDRLLGEMLTSIYASIENIESKEPYKQSSVIKYLKAMKEIVKKNSNSHIIYEDITRKYSNMTDTDVDILIKNLANDSDLRTEQYRQIAKILFQRKLPKYCLIKFERYDEAEKLINEFKSKYCFHDWQIILDKRDITTYESTPDETKSIYVIDGEDYSVEKQNNQTKDSDKNITRIDHLSLPIFSLTNKTEIDPSLFIDVNIIQNKCVDELLNDLSERGCLVGRHICKK